MPHAELIRTQTIGPAGSQFCDVDAVDPNAAAVGRNNAANQAQQGRLATPGRAF